MMRHLGIISTLFFCLAFPRTTQAACDTPNLLIILDKSGSMTNGNKWSAAKSALQSMIQTYENKVRFGLISFSDQPALDAVLPSTQSTILQAVQRIEPKGQTFMVPALQSATNHLREVLFQDTLKGRSTNILFLTDGAPSDRCPVAEVEALQQLSINNTRYPIKTFVIGFGTLINPNCLNQLAEKGQTARTGATKYYVANTQSDLELAMKTITQTAAQTEICNGLDDDCDGEIDNMPQQQKPLQEACHLGGCGGTRFCQQARWSACIPTVAPSEEICDGKDNDCNGLIDDAPQSKTAQSLKRPCQGVCGEGIATCLAGKWQGCTADAKVEICNNKDDNCDGQIDEALVQNCGKCGQQVCNAGAWGHCTDRKPTPEICNNKDDDCDGFIDNAPNFQTPHSLTKACQTDCGQGMQRCKAGTWAACSAPAPKAETCNGKDDDCNGIIDDPWSQGPQTIGATCKTNCFQGTYQCKPDGSGVFCDGGEERKEICDGKDNDCNGLIDEHWPTRGQTCQTGQGLCQTQGTFQCNPEGNMVICVVKDPPQPNTEECNGLDDDCDGFVDEDITRVCQHPCGIGQEVCLEGAWSGCQPPAHATDAACQITTPSTRVDLPSPPALLYAEGCTCQTPSSSPSWLGLLLLLAIFTRRRKTPTL